MSSDHPQQQHDLPSLIGSRICHDLISPIGAIGNGLELLSMSGNALGDELKLISDSVANATARIRFFRIAFGQASESQPIARAEILSVLDDMYRDTRLNVVWNAQSDCRRLEVKAAMLGLLCLESAMPLGGDVEVSRDSGTWKLHGSAGKLRIDPEEWALVTHPRSHTLTAKQVQFALFPEALKAIGRASDIGFANDSITLRF